MASRARIVVDTAAPPARRGDGGRGDALIALGYWVDARLERALVPLAAFTTVYIAGHFALAWARGLL